MVGSATSTPSAKPAVLLARTLAVVRRPHRIRPLRRKRISSSPSPLTQCDRGTRSTEPIATAGQQAGLLRREAKDARSITHGATPAPGDVLTHHCGVLAPIPLIHILQHPLAFAVRKININVWRLGALFAQETLKQQLKRHRINRRNAQAIAHSTIGRGTAALAQNPFAPREAHNVPHNQEVA